MMITAQDFIVLAILDALESSIQGQGMRMICTIDYNLGIKNSWIEFTRKDGKPLEAKDAFWLGYLVREYV